MPDGADVASTEPCQIDKRVMHLQGNDFVYMGALTVTVANWQVYSDPRSIFFMIQIGDISRGRSWELTFESRVLNHDLIPGLYDMAERARVGSQGHPGIEIAGEGRACYEPTGRFQIHDIDSSGNTLDHLLISFEQRCMATPTQLMQGCVRYDR